MPVSYGSEDVKCPFYRTETKNAIKCEGAFSASCTFCFFDSFKKKDHKTKYCNNDYRNCPHYIAVAKKYD